MLLFFLVAAYPELVKFTNLRSIDYFLEEGSGANDAKLEALSKIEFYPFYLSFKLAFITTVILFFFGIFFAWYLANSKSKIRPVLETITALPLVLPPSVIGFYVLMTFSHHSPVGEFFNNVFGIRLVFNFEGLVIASCLYSLPFMIQPLQSGFAGLCL